ncbi:hypothetical protein M9Y10_032097 [Tritrichomonas musculus]|uniref:Uncharacterized protein n=1 Tax=Tritrichomonas musculus TaxID=1915356 RepID=A0ABR2GZ26_9EUKA
MNNREMKNRTDVIIKQTPNRFQIMNKIFLYKNLIENGNENECMLLAPFLETEIFNFIEYLNECIVHAHLFQNSPSFIHEIIKNFYFDGDDSILKSRSIIKYLIKPKATIDECSQILEQFEYLLYEDICELDSFLCTKMSFLDEFNSKIINKLLLLTIKENESVYLKITVFYYFKGYNLLYTYILVVFILI